jgi:hypothetical protein
MLDLPARRSANGSSGTVLIIAVILVSLIGACAAPAKPAAAFVVGPLAIESDTTRVGPGVPYTVTTTIRNEGDDGGTYTATLTVDGVVEARQDVTLEAGATEPLDFPLLAGAPGDHEIALGASSTTLRVSAGPAFEVSGLRLASDDGEILEGTALDYVAAVTNVGSLTGSYEATLAVDGLIGDRQTVSLRPGETATLQFALTAGAPGTHEVAVGEATTTLTVLAPSSVKVTGLVLTPNPTAKGDGLTAAVTVENAGGATGSVVVKVKVDKRTAATQEVTVAGGEQATVDIPLKVPAPGKHDVTAGPLKQRLVVQDITRPKNGKVLTNKIKGGRGSLTVDNGNDVDAVIVLAKKSKPTKTVLAVYVRAGKTAKVKGIKDGTYIVYFSLGRRWDRVTKGFTSDVQRSRFVDKIRFKTTRSGYLITWSTWTLSLHTVFGGNAPTEGVGEGDFPGVP